MGEDKIPRDSDMEESPWDLSTYPAIRHLLEELQQVVTPRYKKADRAALRHQRWHRWTTSLAAFFGTAAILFAVFQLTGFFHSLWPMWAEIAAAIVPLTSVLLGVLQSCQSLWLIERHKAERFRMLKFRSLISPALWRKRTGDIEKWRRWLLQETQEVEALGRKALRNWVHREVGDVPSAISGCTVSDEFLDSLLSYYRNKRVAIQMAYFHRRAERYEGIDKFMRNFPPVFFFLSVICAFTSQLMFLLRRIPKGQHGAFFLSL